MAQSRSVAASSASSTLELQPVASAAPEPISPELVLIDPTLAGAPDRFSASRGGLASPAVALGHIPTLVIAPAAGGGVSARDHPRVSRGLGGSRTVLLLLTVSVLVAGLGILTGSLSQQRVPLQSARDPVAPDRDPTPEAATRAGPPSQASPVETTSRTTSQKRTTARQSRVQVPQTVLGETRSIAEQKVLGVLIRSPVGKLPATLIDERSGLVQNNLQAVCRVAQSSFLCVVRAARHQPNEGLRVRYRPTRDGRGVFTWQRYRAR